MGEIVELDPSELRIRLLDTMILHPRRSLGSPIVQIRLSSTNSVSKLPRPRLAKQLMMRLPVSASSKHTQHVCQAEEEAQEREEERRRAEMAAIAAEEKRREDAAA